MRSLITEVIRYTEFLNFRPNLDEIVTRLATDFLAPLKITHLAVASLITPTKFKVIQEYGARKGQSEALFASLASDFFTENFVQTLMEHNLINSPRDNKTIIAPISNGKVVVGAILCESEEEISKEESEEAKAILLLTSSYLFLKVSDSHQTSSLTDLTVNPLTPRQRQVLAGFIEGKTNHELALELGFSISTIRHETMAIFKTLGASDRKEAAKLAQEHGLI